MSAPTPADEEAVRASRDRMLTMAMSVDKMIAGLRAHQADAWYNQPKPWRWHRCRVVHDGMLDDGVLVERCACGGIRINGGRWMERNR